MMDQSSGTLVEMALINKRFPGVHALKDAEFSLKHGEIHALMGENGAGKSTLMKILAGVLVADSGTITIEGRQVAAKTPREAQALGIGIVHQELALMNDLTVAQNIYIGREPLTRFGLLNEGALNAKARALFAAMNLDFDVKTPVRALSVARQQMVEIAKALSYESKILIMDEPTAALNEREAQELFTVLRQLRDKGVGIIYISHKIDEIKQISGRVTVMRDGATIGTVETATTPIETIITMMVGRALSAEEHATPDLSNAPIALEVKHLSRGKAVRDVGFALRRGEILGFAGLMGAGRTEVARLIFGADRRDGGEILVHGAPCAIHAPQDAVRAGIGYLPEDRKHHGLALGLDVRGNIALASLSQFFRRAFGLSLGFLDDDAMGKTAQNYIRLLEIRTPSERREVRLLSGGNQQKVVIAKWLLRNCDVLVFDEPTRGIDVGAKAEIYRLLRALAAEGKAIIVISSELPEVMRLSHRIAVMCEGRLTGIVPGGGATTQEDIMRLATARGQSTVLLEDAA